jgi:glyoxylase-like metal-dependent hydrolase (beta-lactamase superfamily II)
MHAQLEDEFGDVVGKARRGQEFDLEEVARQTGLAAAELERIEGCERVPEQDIVRRLAHSLGLHPGRLQACADRGFFPRQPDPQLVEGLILERLVLGRDFRVNGYLFGCAETNKGALVDPGFDAEQILKAVEAAGLEIELVLLTHGHGDHIGALSEVCQATGAPALIGRADLPLLGALSTKIEGSIVDGERFAVGRQALAARATPGHTPGGTSLVHERVVFSGDSLFAGSMGGTRKRADYGQLRRTIREHLLGLDDQVMVCPGHGPASTIGEERANNPFFD